MTIKTPFSCRNTNWTMHIQQEFSIDAILIRNQNFQVTITATAANLKGIWIKYLEKIQVIEGEETQKRSLYLIIHSSLRFLFNLCRGSPEQERVLKSVLFFKTNQPLNVFVMKSTKCWFVVLCHRSLLCADFSMQHSQCFTFAS